MRIKNSFWLYAFAAAAAVELWGEASGQRALILWSKPLLMPLLAVWLAAETYTRGGLLRRQMITGLVFATVGDILLMFTEVAPIFFLLGIAFFFFTQLSYAGGFIALARFRNGFLRRQWWWALPFALYLAIFLWQLWPFISYGLRKPLALYGVAITLMVLSIVNGFERLPRPLFWRILAGGVLFLVSDSLIALHRFTPSFSGANVVIMATYIAAQYLLVSGVRNYLCTLPRKATVEV